VTGANIAQGLRKLSGGATTIGTAAGRPRAFQLLAAGESINGAGTLCRWRGRERERLGRHGRDLVHRHDHRRLVDARLPELRPHLRHPDQTISVVRAVRPAVRSRLTRSISGDYTNARGFPSEPGSFRRDSDVRVLSSVTRARAWALTGLATLALSITLVHRQTLAALAATVCSDLAISDVEYGWLSTGLATMFLLGSLPAARLAQRLGPRVGLAATLAVTSLVIGLHSSSPVCRAAPPAHQHGPRGLTVVSRRRARDSSRAALQGPRAWPGLLYLGNSLGSAMCPPLALLLESWVGWRQTFSGSRSSRGLDPDLDPGGDGRSQGRARTRVDTPAESRTYPGPDLSVGADTSAQHLRARAKTGVLRGSVLVASAAPVTLVMLIWRPVPVQDHGLSQLELAKYLWLPALAYGCGSLVFGELRARSARTRSSARPPRRWS